MVHCRLYNSLHLCPVLSGIKLYLRIVLILLYHYIVQFSTYMHATYPAYPNCLDLYWIIRITESLGNSKHLQLLFPFLFQNTILSPLISHTLILSFPSMFNKSSTKHISLSHDTKALVGLGLHLRSSSIILRHTTFGRNPLDEWSTCRRDLYLTTHNTHRRQTSMPPAGFDPTIPASQRPQT